MSGAVEAKKTAIQETIELMLNEFKEETATTRRMLQRVPADKLAWRPHPKSMSLGELALHLARIPGGISKAVQQDGMEVNPVPKAVVPASVEEIHAAFEESISAAQSTLAGLTDDAAKASWRLSAAGREIFSKPRLGVLRTMLLNHWYHHRGQLSVYLRLLEVPVPVIYGRSADENPFAA